MDYGTFLIEVSLPTRKTREECHNRARFKLEPIRQWPPNKNCQIF